MHKILQHAQEIQNDLVKYRRYIHQHAETGLKLPVTSRFVKEKLEEMGYKPQFITESGITAVVGGRKKGKTILLRADMDALPIREETFYTFKSENGNMHACGHDFHTAALLGAARILKEMEDEIPGTVKLMFQPGEEIFSGAKEMIDAGVLKDPDVDAAFMIHVISKFLAKSMQLVFMGDGPAMASNDRFDIVVEGVGCHGAMPSSGIDPFVAATHIHQGILTLNSREIPSDEMMVASIGAMEGGREFNIIPSKVSMKGTLRTYSEEIRKHCKQRIEEIVKNIAAAFRCKASLEYSLSNPSLINDGALNQKLRSYCEELFPGEVVGPEKTGVSRLSPSEDFAFLSREVPAVYLGISADVLEGEVFPQHHCKVDFNEEVLYRAAAVYAYGAVRWLGENG